MHVRHLAGQLQKVIFEWAIPKKYVVHKASLQTLMKRELQEHRFLQPPTIEVRRYTTENSNLMAPRKLALP